MNGKEENLLIGKGAQLDPADLDHKRSYCPKFEKAFGILGKRWNGLIIRTLLEGPARFSEMEETIPNLSARMLSERCRELETEGIIERHVYPEIPVRIEYVLTDKGRELAPALDEVQAWSDKWYAGASAEEMEA